MSRKKVLAAVRRAVSVGALSAVSVVASAQQQPTELEEVVITGSRIAAPNQVSTSPIVVTTAKDIKVSGKSDVSDLLRQLPQIFNNEIGQDLGNTTNGLTQAGAGRPGDR